RLLTELAVGTTRAQVVAWHPDGDRLAVAGSDPRIQVWSVSSKRKLVTLTGHAQRVTTVAFHPDGELLASHGWDGQMLLWQAAAGNSRRFPPALLSRSSTATRFRRARRAGSS